MKAEFGRLRELPARKFGTLLVQTLTGEKGRKPFSVHRIRMKPGAGHPAIFHAKTAELFLVLNGSATAEVDGKRRVIRRGDFAYLPAGAPHAFKAGKNGIEVLSVFQPNLDLVEPDIRGKV